MDTKRRQREIIALVRAEGRVRVNDLAARFDATPQTIRKDLETLAQAHKVVRFHGGASLLAGVEYMRYEARREIAAEAKAAIGAEVARRIPNNAAIFINVGTTTEAAAMALAHHAGLRVITDNVNVANELRKFPGVEPLIVGGAVRGADGAVVGADAVAFIEQFRVDYAIIGAAAIDEDGALFDFDLAEAGVSRAMIANARHVILAADRTKRERTAPVKIGSLADMGAFVTDVCDDPGLARICAEAEVELVEVARKSAPVRRRSA